MMKSFVVLCALVLCTMAESGFRDLRNGVNALDETECQDLSTKEDCEEMARRYRCDEVDSKRNCARSCRVCYKPCEDLKRTCETTSAFFCKRFSSMRKDCPLKCGVCKEGEEMPTNIP
ncbi:uncharacterized protein LOC110252433 [Exaiptasia diaphana]|uniref:ShKT domain-containing protein n=1 Tax=Exaiptasia diaphana TaxID=2652724 RepID=A0A913Y4C5_EXADI|nr:uncharacterized protein LOC110252433 [Exaiptasia diaphana]XP_020914918.1 uncharacterized protein LOC110252433 [Exaiptasia diaphana]